MTLRNQSLDDAERALSEVVKSHAARQRTRLQKSTTRMVEHFGLDEPYADRDRIAAARARSKNVEQRAPEPETDAAPREADAPIGYGPPFIPLAWRAQTQAEARLLTDVGAAYRAQQDREHELALDELGEPGDDSRARMAAAKARPNSRPMRRS